VPGRPVRSSSPRASLLGADTLRRRTIARAERVTTSRSVRATIVSVAGLVGSPVRNQLGAEVGHLVDVVARLYGDERYPPVTGLVMRVGRRRAFLDASAVATIEHSGVRLRTSRLDLRDYTRRPGEVLLARDVLDHQLVDVDGVQVIRAADLYLAPLGNQVRLVGVDVSLQSLLRRIGPRRLRRRPTPDKVIDWDAVAPFSEDSVDGPATVRLRESQQALRRLRPGELADLLEDLARPARRELLASLDTGTAADALEEMDPGELEGLLREAEPAQAAGLLAAMEPDEAVDALRDLSAGERDELLAAMPPVTGEHLRVLLGYRQDRAGGFMSTTLAQAVSSSTVADVRAQLAALVEHRSEIEAVVVLDEGGCLLADLALFDLLTAADGWTLGELVTRLGHPEPLTVTADADVDTVAGALIESRRSSLLVVDDQRRPLGRILADDVLDALRAGESRLHFPRLLS